jgi:hypothetical protein
MRSSHTLLLVLSMFVPSVCHGQAKCPWINEATARGILGGPVILTVKVSEQGDGFHKLRISVDIMTDIRKQFPTYLAQCPPKSAPLRAIGNEAVICSIQGKGDEYAERVVGRVREQAFVVSVSSSAQDDPTMTQGMRREKTNLMAEQVAGILF